MRTTLPFRNPKVDMPHHIEPSKDKLDTTKKDIDNMFEVQR
jgi:hypothetical protein